MDRTEWKFGTKRIKTLGHDLGTAIKGFREGIKEGNDKEQS